METRRHHLFGSTVGIITFSRDKYPVDIIEPAKVADKESLRVGRTHHYHSLYTGFACRMHGVDKILEGKVIGIGVLQVIIICEHDIVIATKHFDHTLMLLNREMRYNKTRIGKHHLFRKVNHSVYRKSLGKELAENVAKHMAGSAEECYFFHN